METQWVRLLALFMERGAQGVTINEISDSRPRGLGIKQYNSRIKDLRGKGYNIVCLRAGHFELRGKSEQEPAYTIEQLKAQREDLLEVYEMTSGYHKQKILKQGQELRKALDVMEALT